MAARDGSEPAAASGTSVERASDRELVISRTFNGPARIVFDAWTSPELVRRWWAPASLGVTAVSCEADVRAGGHYRYVLGHGAGTFAFSGTYREVSPHVRLVYTTFFEPQAQGPEAGAEPAVVTVTFDERDGRTHLVAREVYPSKDVLDAVIATGMESGLRVTMDQLDDLVASLLPR